tara:strand:+ start:2446 stop:3699 length:1254 start_codon:yes stop_codon:yes gene_type:complete
MASKRRGGRASAKRQASARRAKSRRDARGATARGIAASGRNKKNKNRATGGTSTGRESGIAAANTYNRDKKEKSLQQSVGSLDRRVEKALADGNTALAKDLRSRQKNFVKDLAYERARKTPGGIMQGNVRTSDGRRPLTSAGFDVFQETIDQDFIDPTRKLQNRRDGNYKTMYPISAGIQKGLPSARILKKFFGQEEKDIPYNLDDMPGVRYPLDTGFGAGEGEPFFGGRSRDPDFDSYPYIAPVEPVTISDLEDDKSVPFETTVPYQFPIIDPNQRTEESNKMSDIIDSGVQDFATLDKEFQEKGGETKYLPNLSDLVNLGGSVIDGAAYVTGADAIADGLTAVADKAYGYIPVEDFMEETNIKVEQGKSNLKDQYPYLNDAQIDNLYNYNMTGSLSDSLDSDPVVFDDYMTKRLF